MKQGGVTLVGAGPGGAELLTLGGLRALEQADVVLCDALVDDSVLELIPKGTQRIFVGKRAGVHAMPQEEINRLLLELAGQGKEVVRLKGGDPYLFGRGAEELALLEAHGVPYRVIPGVTSAVAAPAWAGIPVTHREHASSLHIFTGHGAGGGGPELDFAAMARLRGTLVFLMAAGKLAEICGKLMDNGVDAATPAALIQEGATPRQRVLRATVSTLAERAAAQGLGAPAVLVIGAVAALNFDGRARLPLAGVSVLVAEIAGGTAELAAMLGESGALVRRETAATLVPTAPAGDLPERLEKAHWLVFTSAYGVELFFRRPAEAGRDLRLLGRLKIAAVGRKTAERLAERGIVADLVPPVYDGAHLAEALLEADRPRGALLFRAAAGGEELPGRLRAGGWQVDDLAAYETRLAHRADPGLAALLQDKGFDWIAFTSASGVEGLAAKAGPENLMGRRCICIGPATARAARAVGMETHTAPGATLDSMVEFLARWRARGEQ